MQYCERSDGLLCSTDFPRCFVEWNGMDGRRRVGVLFSWCIFYYFQSSTLALTHADMCVYTYIIFCQHFYHSSMNEERDNTSFLLRFQTNLHYLSCVWRVHKCNNKRGSEKRILNTVASLYKQARRHIKVHWFGGYSLTHVDIFFYP